MYLFLLLIGTIAFLIRKFFTDRYKFWSRLNVPFLQPKAPFGNLDNFVTKRCLPAGMQFADIYKHFKQSGHRFAGFYILHTPIFLPVDADLVKNILTRDFAAFDAKNLFINERDQPISANLFFIGGEKWKHIRVKMTPTFTSGKMKAMLPILLECQPPMREHIAGCATSGAPLDIKETVACFTTDIIGSAAFGIECNSFASPDAEFRVNGKKIFEETYWMLMKNMFVFNFQDLGRWMGLGPFPRAPERFFTAAIRETIRYRKAHAVSKNDFMQMLIKLLDDGQITFDELVAQAFVFFLAGFETSSTTMTFCMFELAKAQRIQRRVREEMREVLAKYNGEITYEGLNELIYTKQVIDETLRKHPPLMTIDRMATKDYHIEGTDIVIPKGTPTIVSTYGLHHDPEYYPQPEVFDPDRFHPEANNIHPYTYLPFGEGPRLCIGQRFGVMQTKIGLVTLLKDYNYTLNQATSSELQYDMKFVLTPLGNILLDVKKVD